MLKGEAEREWCKAGNALRRVRRLPFAEVVHLPSGGALALLPAELAGAASDAACEELFWKCSLTRYGDPAVRRRLRAVLIAAASGEDAAL